MCTSCPTASGIQAAVPICCSSCWPAKGGDWPASSHTRFSIALCQVFSDGCCRTQQVDMTVDLQRGVPPQLPQHAQRQTDCFKRGNRLSPSSLHLQRSPPLRGAEKCRQIPCLQRCVQNAEHAEPAAPCRLSISICTRCLLKAGTAASADSACDRRRRPGLVAGWSPTFCNLSKLQCHNPFAPPAVMLLGSLSTAPSVPHHVCVCSYSDAVLACNPHHRVACTHRGICAVRHACTSSLLRQLVNQRPKRLPKSPPGILHLGRPCSSTV